MAEPGFIVFQRWDTEFKLFRKVRRKGKTYQIHEKTIDLFPVRVFAESIDRTSVCIANWTRDGELLKPFYAVPNTRIKLWYSRHQILNVNHIYNQEFSKSKNQLFDKVKFLQRCKEVWYVTELLPGVKNE